MRPAILLLLPAVLALAVSACSPPAAPDGSATDAAPSFRAVPGFDPGELAAPDGDAFFILQHGALWADSWPAGWEGVDLLVCNPSFGDVDLARIRGALPGALCLAYLNAQSVPLGMYGGPYWQALEAAFDSSLCIRDLVGGGLVRIHRLGTPAGTTAPAFVVREPSAEALAAFHRDVTLSVGWDGLYVDQVNRVFPPWKRARLLELTDAFDLDADGEADGLDELDALYAAWKPFLLARLRDELGPDRILLGNSGGALADPSLNGITLEGVGERFLPSEARTWLLRQRAVGTPPFLGVIWAKRPATVDPARALAAEIEGVRYGIRARDELDGLDFPAGG